MAAQASQQHLTQTPESLERRLDHDARIFPKPGNDMSGQDGVLLAFDAKAHEPLTEIGFATRLEHTLDVKAEPRVMVPLTWVEGNRILDPQDRQNVRKIEEMVSGIRPGHLGGYFGIKLGKEGMDMATDEVAAGIAALISEVYQGDERLRLLYNHTLPGPAEPIEITGPDYNLAEEATGEHPLVGLDEIVGHPVSLTHVQAAPDLARVSFA